MEMPRLSELVLWALCCCAGYFFGRALGELMNSPLRCRLTGRHLLVIGWAGAPRNGFRCPRCKRFIAWEGK